MRLEDAVLGWSASFPIRSAAGSAEGHVPVNPEGPRDRTSLGDGPGEGRSFETARAPAAFTARKVRGEILVSMRSADAVAAPYPTNPGGTVRSHPAAHHGRSAPSSLRPRFVSPEDPGHHLLVRHRRCRPNSSDRRPAGRELPVVLTRPAGRRAGVLLATGAVCAATALPGCSSATRSTGAAAPLVRRPPSPSPSTP